MKLAPQLGAARAHAPTPSSRTRYVSGMRASLDVLVIEDDIDLRETVVGVLRDTGYQSAGAEDGQRGLDALEVVSPRLILLDILMPEMNGWEFMKHLAGDDRFRAIPLVITTWLRYTPMPKLTVLPKPFAMPALLEVVSTLIGRPPSPALA